MVYIIEMKSKLHLYTSECVFIQRVSSTMFMVLFISINSYETDFMQRLLMQNERKLSRFFNFTICYIDDRVFTAYSFDYVDLFYPIAFTIKNKSYIAITASYLDQHRVPIMNEIDDFIFRL